MDLQSFHLGFLMLTPARIICGSDNQATKYCHRLLCLAGQIAVLLTGIGYRFTEGNHLLEENLEENFRVTLLDSYRSENDCFLLNHKTKSIHIICARKYTSLILQLTLGSH